MATFEAQINGLTGLGATLSASTTPTDTELDQFLKDGVLDVTRRCIQAKPEDASKFARESSEQTSNASLDLNGARIISVVREADTDNDWRIQPNVNPELFAPDQNDLQWQQQKGEEL